MSYILDALKRSEQQRQRGAAPSLLAAQVTDAAPRQSALLAYGVAAAVLLVVGITIGMLRPWRAEAPSPQAVADKPRETVVPAPLPAPAPAAVEITIRTERPAAVPPPPAPPAAGDAVKAPAAAAAAAPPAGPPRPASAPESKGVPAAAERPAAVRLAEAVPERPPLTFAELPPAIQQEIPKLAILFHIYSANPRDRMVGINDRTLREGDAVEPGLVLEQITADGMVLAYKGYRFLRSPR